jgi:hypothetical protein
MWPGIRPVSSWSISGIYEHGSGNFIKCLFEPAQLKPIASRLENCMDWEYVPG